MAGPCSDVRAIGHEIPFSRKTDACQWAREAETGIEQGNITLNPAARRRTVAKMIERYIEDTLPHKRHNKTIPNTIRHLDFWKKEIGHIRLLEVLPDDIHEVQRKLIKGKVQGDKPRAPATCNRYLASLSACFNTAIRWRWLLLNPCKDVERLAEPAGRVRFLSDDERVELLKACNHSGNSDLYTIVVLAVSTGARRGELTGLEWSDVDLERGQLVFRDTKNTETRAVPLRGEGWRLLRERSKVRRIDTRLVFPNKFGDGPAQFQKSWDIALDKAGITDFRFHDLRHTTASYLAMQNVSETDRANILGHKTLAMVKRYSHLSEQHTAGVLERLDESMFGDGNG